MGPKIQDPNSVLNFRNQNFSGEAQNSQKAQKTQKLDKWPRNHEIVIFYCLTCKKS